jgi:HAD superfamily hydrolase (TIGR01549 family)
MLARQPHTHESGILKIRRIGNQRIGTIQRRHSMTNQQRDIRGVFFDWELTLARTIGDVSNDERLTALFQSQSLSYSLIEMQQAIQASRDDFWAEYAQEMPRPQTQQEIIEHYTRILSHLGHSDISETLLNNLYNGYARLPTELYDDALATLQALSEQGVTLSIVSNHAADARLVMEDLVGAYIPPERIVISQEVGQHKPDKSIFETALSLVDIAPEHCLFVGDTLEADAIGAVQQGKFKLGLWLDRLGKGSRLALPEGVIRIRSLYEVLNYI